MTQPEQPETREQKHAIIYFAQANSKAFKELASRVREAKGKTTLVWSHQWRGPESLLPEAKAVIIQEGCPNADAICEAYRQYASDVEIHFVDANGEWDESEYEQTDDGKGQSDGIEGDDTTDQNGDGSVDDDDGDAATDGDGTDEPDADGSTDESEETAPVVAEDAGTEEGGDDPASDDAGDDSGESVSDDSGEAESEEGTDSERDSSV